MQQHRDALGGEKIAELYREAVASARERVSNLCNHDSENLARFEEEAHALTGLCSNFGLLELGQLAAELEVAASKGQREAVGSCLIQVGLTAEPTFHQVESMLG